MNKINQEGSLGMSIKKCVRGRNEAKVKIYTRDSERDREHDTTFC